MSRTFSFVGWARWVAVATAALTLATLGATPASRGSTAVTVCR